MAYDTARAQTVLFGGVFFTPGFVATYFADTWSYAPTNAASLAPFGAGCAGTAGTPALAVQTDQRPWLGDVLTLDLTALPASAPVFLGFGLSRTARGTVALPFALSGLGFAGCTLLTSFDFTRVLTAAGGTATTTTPIPSSQAIVGMPFFAQALVLDPAANAGGATFSNALAGTVGAR